ncbi:hypothetical protein VTK73DRAFT_4946 [Phialemonium thermophilum]|uniref:Uncharacterized protein n=1 Tax=Phialemonium thermophilum TaxID=223376 RepID=A0ABR3WQS4_9PEZI
MAVKSIRRELLEEDQYERLGHVYEFVTTHNRTTIDDEELAALGVVRSTNLDVDNAAPFDFEPRFFRPCYDRELELQQVGRERSRIWGETLDVGKYTNPEWVPNVPYRNPEFRAMWFSCCYDELALLQAEKDEEEGRESDGYTTPHLDDFPYPACALRPETYTSGPAFVAQRETKPHMAIVLCDATVAPEDKILLSELHGCVSLMRYQIRSGRFADHHTKPVMAYTMQWETQGRITQAHYDAKINHLVIRQSRILNLSGPEPTSDAYILLRWMVNQPVGNTQYKDTEPEEARDTGLPNNSSEPKIVVSECS